VLSSVFLGDRATRMKPGGMNEKRSAGRVAWVTRFHMIVHLRFNDVQGLHVRCLSRGVILLFLRRSFLCKGRGAETTLGVREKYTAIGERSMNVVKQCYLVYVEQGQRVNAGTKARMIYGQSKANIQVLYATCGAWLGHICHMIMGHRRPHHLGLQATGKGLAD